MRAHTHGGVHGAGQRGLYATVLPSTSGLGKLRSDQTHHQYAGTSNSYRSNAKEEGLEAVRDIIPDSSMNS